MQITITFICISFNYILLVQAFVSSLINIAVLAYALKALKSLNLFACNIPASSLKYLFAKLSKFTYYLKEQLLIVLCSYFSNFYLSFLLRNHLCTYKKKHLI